MRFFIFLFSLFFFKASLAACPIADQIAREKGLDKALPIYINCALYDNDDETQNYLAGVYEKGKGTTTQNINRTLLFYHLSAENGNATSMVALSNLLLKLDETEEGRQTLLNYLDKIRLNLKKTKTTSFSGQLLHPYALLMLAAEKPDVKWFYMTKTKSDPRAARLMKHYPIEDEKKKEIIHEATLWKQRKMMDIAKEVYSPAEFKEFHQTLSPTVGIPNAFKRSQAVNQLKERIESRLK